MTKRNSNPCVFHPRMVSALKDEFIKEVVCGYSHTLAITIHGQVYSWGNNEQC
jgi:alpha-tubulin suppressor-like RCC1 family protein